MATSLTIRHRPSGKLIATGKRGWDITPFEGSLYIRRRCLRDGRFVTTAIPGLCPYKGLYQWLDFEAAEGSRSAGLGWRYWLPNPLFPFIAWRVAVPRHHPDIEIVETAEEH